MGELIPFPVEKIRFFDRLETQNRMTAKIMLFDGVRYERQNPLPADHYHDANNCEFAGA